jgi:hypothetical protein
MKDAAKIALILVLVMLGGVCANGLEERQADNQQDRLLVFDHGGFDTDLRPIFDEKLLLTPANYGRMIRMHGGPDVGDSAVSVYCETKGGSDAPCGVSLTKAEGNLDYIMAQHRADDDPFKDVRKVKVVRKEAQIPRSAAIAFRDCLRKLLPVDGDRRSARGEGSDYERVEFWLLESDGNLSNGEAPDSRGKRVTTLIQIGDLLARYCEVTQPERAAIAKQVEKEALRVLSPDLNNPASSPKSAITP